MGSTLVKIVSEILELLVARRYSEVFQKSQGSGISANEIETAINQYGCKLVLPPDEAYSLLDIVASESNNERSWSVIMPLFTLEEGRSDLSLLLTIYQVQDAYRYEIDDIHVL